MNKNIILILAVLINATSFSQNQQLCGTEVSKNDQDLIYDFIKRRKAKAWNVNLIDSVVPVKFHIVSYSDSSQGIDSSSIFNEFNTVQSYFAQAGIIFEHCGYIQYVYKDKYADFEKIIDETLCEDNDFFNVLNIYFVPDLYKIDDQDTILLCGYAYLSGQMMNRIIMRNSCSTNGSTLAHEIGHYFSLFHTHYTEFGSELANGTNCSIAGDLICDTPADPGLSINNVNQACVYVGTELDPIGDPYNPNVRNLMSYSRKNCRDYLSESQVDQIKAYFFEYRFYLKCMYNGGISDQDVELEYEIYPNPADDELAFSSNKSPLEGFQIMIYDITGNLVKTAVIFNNSYVSINELNYGCYFISVIYEGQHKIKKFIKL